MITNTISITEVIWTLAGLPGLVVWILNLRSVRASYLVAKGSGDPRIMTIASTLYKLGVGFTITSAIFVVWGVIGMTQEQMTERITLLAWSITLGIVIITVIITTVGIDIRRTMTKIERLSSHTP